MKTLWRILSVIEITVLLCACASTGETLSQNQRAAQINAQLGAGYMRDGNLDVAKIKLERALNQDPKLGMAHWTYALLQMRLGDKKLAEDHFRKAIKLDPKDSLARNNYGTLLCSQGRINDAEKQFLAAVENPLYREIASAYTNAGLCNLKGAEKKQAEAYFRRALESNPSYAPALYQMAKLMFNNEHFLKSRAFMERYLAVAKHSSETLWLGYRVEQRLNNETAANEFAAKLKSSFPNSRETSLLQKK